MVNATPQPLYLLERDSVPTLQKRPPFPALMSGLIQTGTYAIVNILIL